MFILVETSIHCLILVFFIDFTGEFYFRDNFFAVKEDDLFFFFTVFLIVHNFALGMCYSSSLLLLSSNSEITKSPFNTLSLSGLHVFDISPFTGRLHLLHYPCSVLLYFIPLTNLHLVLLFEYWVSSCV